MDAIWEKMGAIIAALITALGGFYMFDRKSTHERLTKLEIELTQSRIDIEVIKTQFSELKTDTQEIKESQKNIVLLLTRKRK